VIGTGLLREFRRQPFRLDPILSGLLLLLMGLGLAVLYSAGDADADLVWRQSLRFGIGIVLLVVASQVPPAAYRRWAPWIYLAGLGLLIAVLVLGVGRGASRWLDLGVIRFQPSEAMKIAVPLALATWLHRKPLPPRITDILVCLVLVTAAWCCSCPGCAGAGSCLPPASPWRRSRCCGG